jgi:glycine/D-amino acid oxidase-like deaminating enzyme
MQIREAIGTRAYRGGLLNMGSGHLHPLKLCLGEARAAVAEGAQIFERSAVTRIEHGARPKVHTDKGQVESDFVILAGGAYHALEEENIGGIVFPAGSFIIATEQLPEELLGEINPMCLAVCDPNYVLDYFRTSADGRMLFGGRCNYSGREPRSIRKTMQPRMVKIYPQLKDVRIEYEWGGKIGIVINRIPYMGRIGKNVFFSQGYCGHGVNVTHLAGQLLAEVVAGTSERFDIFERVKHYRLPGARWIGNNLVALGMVYFRMLDMRP